MKMFSMVSLFTGAGGLDYGLEAAGFETITAVEMDPSCCNTLRSNRSSWNILERNLVELDPGIILESAQLEPYQLDLLIGGPPCQPFSKSGYWATGDSKRLHDPRSSTLEAYMQVVEKTLPRVFLLENVEGLAFEQKNEGFRFLCSRIEDINRRNHTQYRPYTRILNAADYGVPQLRERFFLIATRDGASFRFPPASHAPKHLADSVGLRAYHTVWDAIGDLELNPDEDLRLRGKWANLLPSIPEGSNYLWHTPRGGGQPLFGWRTRYWNFLLKLSKDQPSWTIQAQPGPSVGPFHWHNRRLSARELCRLQTFPDDIEIWGGRTALQRQIGNAVPSLLAEVLGRAIRAQLFNSPLETPLRLLPPVRSPIPPPEAVAPVPEQFRTMIGHHKDHPGTGKGSGALKRNQPTLADELSIQITLPLMPAARPIDTFQG